MAQYSAVHRGSPSRDYDDDSDQYNYHTTGAASPPLHAAWADMNKAAPYVGTRRRATLRERAAQHAGHLLVSWWAWELVAAVSSVLAMGALIGLLIQANGQVQQSYPFGQVGITLNTIVAVLATIGRASTLVVVAGPLGQSAWNWFASSAHGRPRPTRPLADLDTFGDAVFSSWSSIKLMWRTRGCSLAALGALLTVLAFFYDAFVQQVLDFELRAIHSNDFGAQSSLPRAASYVKVNQSDPYLDMSWFAGIVNPDAAAPDSWCPTGNCTWPTTPTLGVCNKCKDLTSVLRREDIPIQDNNTDTNFLQNATMFEYSLPTNAWEAELGYFDQWRRIRYARAAIGFSSMPPYVHNLNGSKSSTFNPQEFPSTVDYLPLSLVETIGMPIASLDKIIAAYGHDYQQNITADFVDPLVHGYSCFFYFCLQAFNGTTHQGNTTQHQVATWSKMEMVTNGTWQFVDVPEALNVDNITEYQVTNETWLSFPPSIGNYFEANISKAASGLDTPENMDGGTLFAALALANAAGSIANMTAFLGHVADGVTNYMRVSMPGVPPSSNATLYAPVILKEATFVAVRWGWLAFPLFIFLAALVFLFATMLETRRLRARPWKSHRLPLLLARLDPGMLPAAAPGLDEWHGVRNRVGDVPVRLAFDAPDHLLFERNL